MYEMGGSHASEDGYHLSTRLHVNTSWKTIILTTLSTAVPRVRGDKTTDWLGLRACLKIERERNPWLYRN